DGIRGRNVTGVQTCALPIYSGMFLLFVAEKKVVGAVWHQQLTTNVAGGQTACGRISRSRSAFCVQSLNKSRLRERSAARRSLIRADHLQQQAVNRAAIGATCVGSRANEILFLRPHPAAIKRTLPGYITETWRLRPDVIRIHHRAQEVSDDLYHFSENVREESCFRAGIVDGPGYA